MEHGATNLSVFALSPTTRRRFRGRGTVVLDNLTGATQMNQGAASNLFSHVHLNLATGNVQEAPAPTPSPDELVIQARGRRKVPLTFSPDVHVTPIRARPRPSNLLRGPPRLMLPTRTSPRKRLNLTDSPPGAGGAATPFETPSPESKAARKQILGRDAEASPLTRMKSLNRDQLADVIAKVISAHPELEEEVTGLLPSPDLGPMEDRLLLLKRNIFKSLPNTSNSRLESKTDSLAYSRVATHLLMLKKAMIDQTKALADGQQWAACIQHAVMAWGYVKGTPTWDNPVHNNVRKGMFRILGGNCLAAVKKGKWNAAMANELKKRLSPLEKESEDIAASIRILNDAVESS